MLEECAESCSRKHTLGKSKTLYDIIETDINGNTVDFNDFKNSIVYIVNVASQCGYTAQNYEIFRSLSKYKNEGFQIVIAPCNQVE